jgi:hypothetical protein
MPRLCNELKTLSASQAIPLPSPRLSRFQPREEHLDEDDCQRLQPCRSSAPLPNDADTRQIDGIREFREALSERGLLGEFANVNQLQHEVWKAIEFDIARLDLDAPSIARTKTGVRLPAQPQQEREVDRFDRNGRPHHTTRHWIDVANTGDEDATDATFEAVGENSSMMAMSDKTPTVIHAGQTRRLDVFHHMGGCDPDFLRIRWTEDGEAREREFHVG